MDYLILEHWISAMGGNSKVVGPFAYGHYSNISTERMSSLSLNPAQDREPSASLSILGTAWKVKKYYQVL